jgi:membrane-associated protease RseP (regulator of RpoE activity)
MRTSFSPRRLVRYLLAIAFAGCATTYSVLWITQIKHSTPQHLFTNYNYSPATRSITVGEVTPGSAAAQAGLNPGDRIVAINGLPLENLRPFYEAFIVGQWETVVLTVEDLSSPAGRCVKSSV